MTFTKEKDFEDALINKLLTSCGWENVLEYPTEQDLIDNWARILFNNNREIDKLGDIPLTDSEMQQILGKVKELGTPYKLNGFINGKNILITRDAESVEGKQVSLKIYDRSEIAGGQSKYQIARQPIFKTANPILPDRRGDVMLLINGMPVIHIELKRSGIAVAEAYNQIRKYMHENVFYGIYSLVQVFVAMTPEETLYFANPGSYDRFNPDFYFHWADFNNIPINDWDKVAEGLLSIPTAHELIGFYTVADAGDETLKVMRSYQIYAAKQLANRLINRDWTSPNRLGGYIWATTGSGKTMTSFKSAQLIANSNDADKIIFLVDRIELGTQSLDEYRNFSNDDEEVQATESTAVLKAKLESDYISDRLIVTSIQKLSRLKVDNELLSSSLEKINQKRLVIVIDEAHRDTFGEMLINIKDAFPRAVIFGFTGTPIYEENQRNHSQTVDIFGDELHRYTIMDGIRDGNVLAFDIIKVATFKDNDLRKAVALHEVNAATEEEALNDQSKIDEYMRLTGNSVSMIYIEKMIPTSQYRTDEHQDTVIADIKDSFLRLSRNKKFHTIFAVSSINEAIQYYEKMKVALPDLKITAQFDNNIDNNEEAPVREDAIAEILTDYNHMFNTSFEISTYGAFKKDISKRLAHKKPYEFIDGNPEEKLDILIVVDQMLTGYDSKWVNTLYLDKTLRYEAIIQAFSRTNRVFNKHEKPFGIIKYYRRVHTMEANINDALEMYAGENALKVFVPHIGQNLNDLNYFYDKIDNLFESAGIDDFEKLPYGKEEISEFALLFSNLEKSLEASRIQGFRWNKLEYSKEELEYIKDVDVQLDEITYEKLKARYREIRRTAEANNFEITYELDGYIVEFEEKKIDYDYMNSQFTKYLVNLDSGLSEDELDKILSELHSNFGLLSQDEQRYANTFLDDIRVGRVKLDSDKTFMEYVQEYQLAAHNDKVHKVAENFGVDEEKLRNIVNAHPDESNINEFNRFTELLNTVDKDKAKSFLESETGEEIPIYKVQMKASNYLKDYILNIWI